MEAAIVREIGCIIVCSLMWICILALILTNKEKSQKSSDKKKSLEVERIDANIQRSYEMENRYLDLLKEYLLSQNKPVDKEDKKDKKTYH